MPRALCLADEIAGAIGFFLALALIVISWGAP